MMSMLRGQWKSARVLKSATGKVYTFDVGFATDKDTLKTGEPYADFHRVSVEAEDENKARLLAEQMVAAVGHEPTEVVLVSSPDLDREVLG